MDINLLRKLASVERFFYIDFLACVCQGEGAFPSECHTTLLRMRLASTNLFIGAHNLILVEMDSTKIFFI